MAKDVLTLRVDVNVQSDLLKNGIAVLTHRSESAKINDTVMLVKGQANWSARVKITEINITPGYKPSYRFAPRDWSIEVVEAFVPDPAALAFWLAH